MAHKSPYLVTDYRDDLRLFGSSWKRFGLVLMITGFVITPLLLDDFWLGVLAWVAVYAIGGIGLNLLTGYAGLVSLGTAVFVGVGAYAASWFGGEQGWPLLLWLPACGLVGAAIGSLIGPVALRLSGQYLAIVTLGLLFVGEHIMLEWSSLTGGTAGVRINQASLAIGPLDFNKLNLFGTSYTREQGIFWLIWAVVALVALLTKNITRTRPGRALQAIRDRDVAAEIIGVSLFRYKVAVFALSSGIAAIAGGFYGAAIQRFVTPPEFGGLSGLVLSITFVAVIIVGGMGTISGSILGALVVAALPRVTQRFVDYLPFLKSTPNDDGIILVGQFNLMLFGVLIIVFLLTEPLGLAALWRRITTYFKTWPFSY
jgi:branched-chain amino acid transport system permease protein